MDVLGGGYAATNIKRNREVLTVTAVVCRKLWTCKGKEICFFGNNACILETINFRDVFYVRCSLFYS